MRNDNEMHGVRIHINHAVYHSPNPTSGNALYALGSIPEGERLYREVSGDEEDMRIPRDNSQVDLTEDEHFYSQLGLFIFVNQDEHEIKEKKISYAEVVELFLGSGGKSSNQYLIKYSHGPVENPSGTLAPEQKVVVKDGMRFRISGTGES